MNAFWLFAISQVAAAFVDGRLPKASSLLLGSSGGGRGAGYTPGPAIMVQVRQRLHYPMLRVAKAR